MLSLCANVLLLQNDKLARGGGNSGGGHSSAGSHVSSGSRASGRSNVSRGGERRGEYGHRRGHGHGGYNDGGYYGDGYYDDYDDDGAYILPILATEAAVIDASRE